MTSPAQLGFGSPGAPGSKQEAAYKRDHLTWITLNCGVRLLVRTEAGFVFKGFWDELEKLTGYTLADGHADDWGFANRPNRNNPSVLSLHAYGLATDGNAESNPNTHDGRIHTNLPIPETHALAAKWHLRWGADYTGNTKDPMHVEWIGSLQELIDFVAQLQSLVVNPPQEEEDMLIIYRCKDNSHSPLEILSDHGVLIGIPDGEDAIDLVKGGAKYIDLEPPLFDAIKAKAGIN